MARHLLKMLVRCLLPGAACALLSGAAGAVPGAQVEVTLSTRDDGVVLDVTCLVAASPAEVWAVVTDYEHAASFIANLEKSSVLERSANRMLVSQKGKMGFGPFSVNVETVTEVRLTHLEGMRSRLIRGSMKRHESTTRLIPENGGTRIVYHAVSVPDVWIPPVIGPAIIRHEAQTRFEQLLVEILRRKAHADASR
jgi:ribosome-associated toxin RatA of RatAB toxin-antitoxin module